MIGCPSRWLHRVGEKQAGRKRRSTADILAEIEAIEQQATSFILDGAMEFPDGVKVAATSPIETVEFVQTAADGSIAADCSSGTCECSAGFIDYGNGCEKETDEQEATTTEVSTTTEFLTTTTTTTTQGATVSALDWIPSLVDKIQAVFEQNRPGKSREHLLRKWETLSSKFVKRFGEVADNGCDFTNTYTDNSVDFDSVDTCRVSFRVSDLGENKLLPITDFQDINQVEAAFATWGRQYTYDCKKVKKNKHKKWFDRNNRHVKRVANKTRDRLNC